MYNKYFLGFLKKQHLIFLQIPKKILDDVTTKNLLYYYYLEKRSALSPFILPRTVSRPPPNPDLKLIKSTVPGVVVLLHFVFRGVLVKITHVRIPLDLWHKGCGVTFFAQFLKIKPFVPRKPFMVHDALTAGAGPPQSNVGVARQQRTDKFTGGRIQFAWKTQMFG